MKSQDIFIAHPKTYEQVHALKAFMQALKIKFETSKEESYSSDFIAKIQKSKQEYQRGEFISVEKKDLKNFLGLG
jgi:hypothetical protein